MTAMMPIAAARPRPLAGWRAHLGALAALCAAILVLFAGDATDMAAIWWNSSTFNHCLLIPFILAWLVRQRMPELRQLAPAAWAPGLALVALGSLAWLLGEASGVDVARHLGLVLMLLGAVIACLGKAVARGLAFPLFYALFLVPAGEEIVPLLQTVTARMCMALLSLVGIPAHIEGVFITTPGGYFEVAEACSGVKFLIAMAALGALVANLCFKSWTRRALFLATALAIPILANGVRAFATIAIAEKTGTDFAAGVDHVVYGWFFFAIVITLILAAGRPFFDRGPNAPWFDPARLSKKARKDRLMPVAAATLALAALSPIWSGGIAAAADPVGEIDLPEVSGWTQIADAAPRPWRPHFDGADILRLGHYRDAEGRRVDLAVAVFARQEEGHELVGYGQGAAPPDGAWAWTADITAPRGGRGERLASHGATRDVVSFYRIGHVLTGSPAQVKLATLKARLLGGSQRAAAILVSAEGPEASAAIRDFLAALGPVGPLAGPS